MRWLNRILWLQSGRTAHKGQNNRKLLGSLDAWVIALTGVSWGCGEKWNNSRDFLGWIENRGEWESAVKPDSSITGLSEWLDGDVFWEGNHCKGERKTLVFNNITFEMLLDIQIQVSRRIWILEENLVILLFLLLLVSSTVFSIFTYQSFKHSQDFPSFLCSENPKKIKVNSYMIFLSFSHCLIHSQISGSCIHCFHFLNS